MWDMSTTVKSSTTAAFLVQAAISFGVSLAACLIGAFLGLALVYAVTSTFTLAKCVRDRQDTATIAGRVDQARLDKLLAEHDPFKVDT
jgi:hypothetical protein